MRIDEAATWICVGRPVFFTRKRQVSHFVCWHPWQQQQQQQKKKWCFLKFKKNEFTNFQ